MSENTPDSDMRSFHELYIFRVFGNQNVRPNKTNIQIK